ncbi:MAG: hypothetical protein AMXMBFR64_35480 [Myxococcales bacterium]
MRSKHAACPMVAAILIALSVPAWAAGDPSPSDAEGSCASPRQALFTVLYWLQAERHDPAKAAACVDRSGLEDPVREAPAVADKLKKVLDARGLYVLWPEIPDAPDHAAEGGGATFDLYPKALGGVIIARTGDRWLFSPASCARIDELYRDTFPAGLEDFIASLPTWLQGRLLGIQGWQVLALLLLVFVALGLQKLAVALFATYLRRIARRLPGKWLEKVVQRSDRPVGGLVMAAVFAMGVPLLQFPVQVAAITLLATRVLAAFSLVWLGYRLADVLCDALDERAARTETRLDDQLVPLLRKSIKVVLVVVGGIFILQNLDVDVGSLLAGLGLGGLAFALAAKDTVANFFGSVMIFIDKPFQIGDWIKISDAVEGTVAEVGFRTTRIRTFYNSMVTVPNALVTNTAIDNLGARTYRRYKATLGLTYDTAPEKVQAFCEGVRAVILALPGMRKDFYMVEFQGFGAHSLDILLYCFMHVPDWATELRTRTNLNLEILRLARELGVEFAFPTQTLHVQMGAAVEARDGADVPALAEVIRSFGPGGRLSLNHGFRISQGFDPGGVAGSRGSADADG